MKNRKPAGKAMTDQVRFLKIDPAALPPVYGSEGAAGADLRARLVLPVTIAPLERRRIPTGLALELPAGYEGQVRPRSGLAYKYGITVLNSPGTIDSDYRGEIQVILVNLGSQPFTVNDGDRIAQIVIAPFVRCTFACGDLSRSARGEGGFGSTGS